MSGEPAITMDDVREHVTREKLADGVVTGVLMAGVALFGAAGAFRVATKPIHAEYTCNPNFGSEKCVRMIAALGEYSTYALALGGIAILVAMGATYARQDNE